VATVMPFFRFDCFELENIGLFSDACNSYLNVMWYIFLTY